MNSRCLVTFTALLLSACFTPVVLSNPVYYNKTETIPYQVLEDLTDNIQIRRYPSALAVGARQTSRNSAFRLLFRYISGENQARQKIAMTTPVEMASEKIAMTTPVEMTSQSEMLFFLPSQYNRNTAPVPVNQNVRLIDVPQRTVAVIRYSGLNSESRQRNHLAELREVLQERGISLLSRPNSMGYDSPWTAPWNRRNEMLIEVDYAPMSAN